VELLRKYPYEYENGLNDSPEKDQHNDLAVQVEYWADECKTTILLNGGMQSDLRDIICHFEKPDNPYPWEYFRESHDALNAALTNVSIVLPEKIYMYKRWIEAGDDDVNGWWPTKIIVKDEGTTIHLADLDKGGYIEYHYSQWELELIKIINSKRLMS
jgi:hypothetical protein